MPFDAISMPCSKTIGDLKIDLIVFSMRRSGNEHGCAGGTFSYYKRATRHPRGLEEEGVLTSDFFCLSLVGLSVCPFVGLSLCPSVCVSMSVCLSIIIYLCLFAIHCAQDLPIYPGFLSVRRENVFRL